MTRLGVRRLAAAMMGMDAMEVAGLRGAVRARPVGRRRGDEPDDGRRGRRHRRPCSARRSRSRPPETRFFATPAEAADAYELTPHVTTRRLHAARRAVPARAARPERVRRAHEGRVRRAGRAGGRRRPRTGPSRRRAHLVRRRPRRARARLGRARPHAACRSAAPSACATGAVVELDRAPDDPVDLFVNGRLFGTGRLLLVEDEWAVRIETVLPGARAHPASDEHTEGGTN